jgi:hypothetical protein
LHEKSTGRLSADINAPIQPFFDKGDRRAAIALVGREGLDRWIAIGHL